MFKATVLCLCLCIPAILVRADEMEELIGMLHSTCVEQSGVEEQMIADVRKGIFAEAQSLKCYMKCLMVEVASMGDDGLIDVEATLAMLPPNVKAKFGDTIKKCGTKIGVDHCDNAYLTHKCYYEDNPQNYVLY